MPITIFSPERVRLMEVIDRRSSGNQRSILRHLDDIIHDMRDELNFSDISDEEEREEAARKHTLTLLLLVAISYDYQDLADEVIARGADINASYINSRSQKSSLLKLAKADRRYEIADQVADHPDFIPDTESVIFAMDDDNLRLLEKYLRTIRYINLQGDDREYDNIGAKALVHAIKRDYSYSGFHKPRFAEMVKLLLLYGVDSVQEIPILNIQYRGGSRSFKVDYSFESQSKVKYKTPLEIACGLRVVNPEIISYLLDFGAIVFSHGLEEELIYSDSFGLKLAEVDQYDMIAKRLSYYAFLYRSLERVLNLSSDFFEKESTFQSRRHRECTRVVAEAITPIPEELRVSMIQSIINSEMRIKGQKYNGLVDFASAQKDVGLMRWALDNGGRTDFTSRLAPDTIRGVSEKKESKNTASKLKSWWQSDDFKVRSEITRLLASERTFHTETADYDFLPVDAVKSPAMVRMLRIDMREYPRGGDAREDSGSRSDAESSRSVREPDEEPEEKKKSNPPVREKKESERPKEKPKKVSSDSEEDIKAQDFKKPREKSKDKMEAQSAVPKPSSSLSHPVAKVNPAAGDQEHDLS